MFYGLNSCKTLRQLQQKCRSLTLVLAAVVALCTSSAQGDLILEIPGMTVVGDGVTPTTGTFDVILNLTGSDLTSPPDVSSFNVDFYAVGVNSSNVTFVTKTTPTASSLFNSGTLLDFSTSDQHVQVAHDIFDESPDFAVSFDGARLVTVEYSVDAGFFGTIPLEFTTSPLLNEIADPSAIPLTLSFSNGAITVIPVPEASTLLIWGVGSVSLAFCSRRRRPQIQHATTSEV